MSPKLTAIAFVMPFTMLSCPSVASAQDGRQACQSDAFRLCGYAIPNRERVKACLIANRRQLSPACRQLIASAN
jgi:hypothetical protein